MTAGRSVLRRVALDEALRAVVGRQLPDGDVGDRWASLAKRVVAEKLVVPVLGVQGTGKSTLLSALISATPILPVDADETTCVPVELVHGPAGAGATVKFRDGRTLDVPATEHSLSQFVHNGQNPGNALGVDRIIVPVDSELLADGLTLVDLPGTGSLTAANLATTKAYLDDAVGVVYMLRTVPPLTLSETISISPIWSRIPLALFVQNRWSDESDRESDEGRDHNVRVLAGLAERHRIPAARPIEILVVNAYDSFKGRLEGDTALRTSAGLSALEQRLTGIARTWREKVLRQTADYLSQDLTNAIVHAERRIADLHTGREAVLADLAADAMRFKTYLEDLKGRAAAAQSTLDSFRQKQQRFLEGWKARTGEELRNVMRTKMRGGIVDGPRLSRALTDEQRTFQEQAFDEVQAAVAVVADEVNEKFEGSFSWNKTRPDASRGVNSKETTKVENLAPTVLGGVAGAGGGFGGGVAGFKLGAAIGLGGGPIGAAIGGFLGGVVGGLFGLWVGRKTKEGVLASRAKAAEPLVFDAIDAFVCAAKDSLCQSVHSASDGLVKVIELWLAAQETRYAAEAAERRRLLELSAAERASALTAAEGDMASLRAGLASIEGAAYREDAPRARARSLDPPPRGQGGARGPALGVAGADRSSRSLRLGRRRDLDGQVDAHQRAPGPGTAPGGRWPDHGHSHSRHVPPRRAAQVRLSAQERRHAGHEP